MKPEPMQFTIPRWLLTIAIIGSILGVVCAVISRDLALFMANLCVAICLVGLRLAKKISFKI